MLCQKCGLQEATVHLIITVFRQQIEEHLCRLCAGKRAPTEPAIKVETSALSHSVSGPLRSYLKQLCRISPMNRKEEQSVVKRLEKAERKAAETLFQLAAMSPFFVRVAERLLRGQERFDRIVSAKKLKSRDAYMRRLPKLVKALQRLEMALKKVWAEHLQSPTRSESLKALTAFTKLQSKLRCQLPPFFFKLRVLEEFVFEMQPVLDEITSLFEQLKRADSTKIEASLTQRKIEGRLRAMGTEYRSAPGKFLAVFQRAKVYIKDFHVARRRLMQAQLQLVIASAVKYLNPRVSFLDLVVEGNRGLLTAIERFDYPRGYPLPAFAAFYVDAAVARYVADHV